ncbi:MAG: hypothetical protein ACNS62_11880 [Candidatus Cyclobacteriaceae bacterium M3_2C_046]
MKDRHKHIKLNQLPKDTPFKVPEQYFEELPQHIQSRVNQPRNELGLIFSTVLSLKFMVPVLLLLAISVVWINWDNTNNLPTEELLAQVDDEAIIRYLQMNDLNTDQLIQDIVNNNLELDLEDQELDMFEELELDQSMPDLYEEYGISQEDIL